MKRTGLHRKKGQALLELILTLFGFFTIAFLYVQIALDFSVANYIQYATFMASRAFMAAYPKEDKQRDAATSVLRAMLQDDAGRDRFSGIVKPAETTGEVPGSIVYGSKGIPTGTQNRTREDGWQQGIAYKFTVRMYMLPMIPLKGRPKPLTLESESFLGREPTAEECENYLKARQNKYGGQSVFLYDNGC